MKKILLSMAILLPFVFTSCGDDKDEPKQNLEQELIGTWVGDLYDIVDGEMIVTHPHSAYILFNADHTGKTWSVIDGVNKPVRNFNWSLKGNILTIEDGSEPVIISIDGDVLHIKQGTIDTDLHRAKG